jgi:hypothetical protein
MRVDNRYDFGSCSRTFYEGYRLFLHIKHSAGEGKQ